MKKAKKLIGLAAAMFAAGAAFSAVSVTAFADGTWTDIGNAAVENTDYAVDSSGNYTIYTGAGLAHLANVVNGGDSLEGKTVTLADDIAVEDDASSQNTWTPVGNNDNPFSGVFNGNNHTISANLQAKNRDMGIFGTNTGSIENLTLNGSIILHIDESEECSLGLTAVNMGNISACINNASISSSIENIKAYNNGSSRYTYIGGIAGQMYAVNRNLKITNCINNGSINCTNNSAEYRYAVGGICASIMTDSGVEINSCTNTANIVVASEAYAMVGGIAGGIMNIENVQNSTVIKNCANISNNSAINITKCVDGSGGGIAGIFLNSQVMNCYNTQDIITPLESKTCYSGGIVGGTEDSWPIEHIEKIENCVNTGKNITGKSTNSIVPGLSSGTANFCYASNNSGADISGILNSSLFDENSGKLETPVTINGSEISNVAEALNAYVAAHPDEGYKTWSSYDSFGKAEPLISSIVLRQIKPAEENGNTSATAVVTNVSCSGLTVNKLTWEYNGLSAVYDDTALSGDTVFSFGIIIPEFVEADSNSSPVGLNVTAE